MTGRPIGATGRCTWWLALTLLLLRPGRVGCLRTIPKTFLEVFFLKKNSYAVKYTAKGADTVTGSISLAGSTGSKVPTA